MRGAVSVALAYYYFDYGAGMHQASSSKAGDGSPSGQQHRYMGIGSNHRVGYNRSMRFRIACVSAICAPICTLPVRMLPVCHRHVP